MTYEQRVRDAAKELSSAGVTEAELDARRLMESVAHLDLTGWLLHREETMTKEQEEDYQQLVSRRCQREPLQQILGEQEFCGLRFYVTKDVLVPRPETELLVCEVLAVCKGKSVLDLCTGSGCIGISLQKLGQPKSVVASDISANALAVARANAAELNAEVTFLESNLFEKISGHFDVIVSNPPYIPPKQLAELSPEVAAYEPRLALYGGEDGLDFYRKITAQAEQYMNKGAYLMVEIGFDQGESVSSLFREAGFEEVTVKRDYAGLDRIVFGHL